MVVIIIIIISLIIIIIIIIIIIRPHHGDLAVVPPEPRAVEQQPKTYPHPWIPAARLFFFILCFCPCFLPWGENPEVGGGLTSWIPRWSSQSPAPSPGGGAPMPRAARHCWTKQQHDNDNYS